MEFKDVVYGRRSVRRFKDTLVDDKILKEIVDAALWAPSGVNLQPWYYVGSTGFQGQAGLYMGPSG